MIVNPQLFNYRLIIGSLVVAIVVLGSYSFSSYSTLKNHQEFIEQETRLVQNELSEMISRYDEVSIDNQTIRLQIDKFKSKIKSILDSVNKAESNLPLISKYRDQIVALKVEKESLFALVDSFNQENETLKKETKFIAHKLQKQEQYSSSLEAKNSNLSETIKYAEVLSANNIKAKALKQISLNKQRETDRARRVDALEVCFTLAENLITPEGNKELYIQVLDPQNNVVSNKGFVNFGESTLIYSDKIIVNYTNSNLDVCTSILADSGEELNKGLYFISVFHESKALGNTQIELK